MLNACILVYIPRSTESIRGTPLIILEEHVPLFEHVHNRRVGENVIPFV